MLALPPEVPPKVGISSKENILRLLNKNASQQISVSRTQTMVDQILGFENRRCSQSALLKRRKLTSEKSFQLETLCSRLLLRRHPPHIPVNTPHKNLFWSTPQQNLTLIWTKKFR
jgi:hypothetical protein